MTTRQEIIAEAETWLNTKWHHQASCKGVGADCVGLVSGVMRHLGHNVITPNYYGRYPSGDQLMQEMHKHCIEVTDPQPGDLFVFQQYKEPQHIGFVYEMNERVIHSVTRKGVRITTIEWDKIVSYFTFDGVTG